VTYHPDLYDVVTPRTFRGDVEWYRRKAQECGGPVLELGAGRGHVTLAIAEAGVVVYALDRSPAMLAALDARLARVPQEVRKRVTPEAGHLVHHDVLTKCRDPDAPRLVR
jgi:ubiquinone/menaquinone biosynthesis C-methylase UbiE